MWVERRNSNAQAGRPSKSTPFQAATRLPQQAKPAAGRSSSTPQHASPSLRSDRPSEVTQQQQQQQQRQQSTQERHVGGRRIVRKQPLPPGTLPDGVFGAAVPPWQVPLHSEQEEDTQAHNLARVPEDDCLSSSHGKGSNGSSSSERLRLAQHSHSSASVQGEQTRCVCECVSIFDSCQMPTPNVEAEKQIKHTSSYCCS
jgi:hypothetical protein